MARTETTPRSSGGADVAAGDYSHFVDFLRTIAGRARPAVSEPDDAEFVEAVAFLRAVAAGVPGLHVSVAIEALDVAGLDTVARLVEKELTARAGWMSAAQAADFLTDRSTGRVHASRKDSK